TKRFTRCTKWGDPTFRTAGIGKAIYVRRTFNVQTGGETSMRFRWPKFAAAGVAVCCCVALMSSAARATINVITTGDPIIPIDRDLVTYTSSYPLGTETPSKAIDNLELPPNGTKYTNFGRFSTCFTIQPTAGATTIKAFEIDTANDNEPRDPASYELYG